LPIKIKSQKDYLTTEAAIEVPLKSQDDFAALDRIMRSSKATGKIVAVYNQGGLMNLNIDQKTYVSEKISEDVRKIVGVGTRELESK
jgi:hypothetical protein